MVMGFSVGNYMWATLRFRMIRRSQRSSLAHFSVAYISALEVLLAVTFYCLDYQWSGTLNMIINSDMEKVFKSSSFNLDMNGFDLDLY